MPYHVYRREDNTFWTGSECRDDAQPYEVAGPFPTIEDATAFFHQEMDGEARGVAAPEIWSSQNGDEDAIVSWQWTVVPSVEQAYQDSTR